MKKTKKPDPFKIDQVDVDNPIEALAETLIKYSYEMGQLQRKYKAMTNAKVEKDLSKARLFLILKDEIQENGRPWNNDMVDMGILDDDEYQEVLKEYTALDIGYQNQYAIVNILDKKIEILRTAAASRRSEFNKQMS